jgi:hypothetical protein
MAIITLKFEASCSDCGAWLPAGARARWYGQGRFYGIGCHGDSRLRLTKAQRALLRHHEAPGRSGHTGEPIGRILSRLDPYGVYTADGQKIGSTCGCEDYPCCGH